MKRLDISARVETDGELRVRSPELKAGQRVEATLIVRDAADPGDSVAELRGIFKGTWGGADAVDRYLQAERDSWRQ